MSETEQQRWIRRAGDATIEAVLSGVDPEEIRAAVEAGIREGQRIAALRRGEASAASSPRATGRPMAAPGSATEALLRATGVTA